MKVRWLTIKSPCRKFQFHLFISGGEDKILYCLNDMTCNILLVKTPKFESNSDSEFSLEPHFYYLKKRHELQLPAPKKVRFFLFLTKVCPIKVSRSHSQGLSLFQSCVLVILLRPPWDLTIS